MDAPSTSALAGSLGSATGPAGVPNMIGDLLGGGGTRVIIPRIETFSGPFLDANGNPAQFFGGLSPAGTVLLTSLSPVSVGGVPLPSNSEWESRDVFSVTPPPPSNFPLRENSDETAATQQAFPGSQASFQGGSATAAGTGSLFSVATNYLLIFPGETINILVPSPSSGVVGRGKISDNNSPMPRDRVFLDYSFFHNAELSVNGVDVNRFTPGFEKTFLGGTMSFELRTPMASTLDSTILTDGVTSTSATEFGNMALIFKGILAQNDRAALAGGMGFTLPTGNDITLGLADGIPLVQIDNDAVRLLPYLAAVVTPNDRWFVQGYYQIDVGANGNELWCNLDGRGLRPVGKLNDQTLMHVDLAVGSWLFRNENARGRAAGLAWTMEGHYTGTISEMDSVRAGSFVFGDPSNDVDILDLTLGAHLLAGQSVLTAGYSMPLTSDREFDGELRVFFNRYF